MMPHHGNTNLQYNVIEFERARRTKIKHKDKIICDRTGIKSLSYSEMSLSAMGFHSLCGIIIIYIFFILVDNGNERMFDSAVIALLEIHL